MKNRFVLMTCLFCLSLTAFSQKDTNKSEKTFIERSQTSVDPLPKGDGLQDQKSMASNLATSSLNLVSGKVGFQLPVASVTSNRISAGVNLKYSGGKALKDVNYSNKYKPTGVVGLGWDINRSKIVCDNKQTGYRDDDVFYFQDGGNYTKLVCVNKNTSSLYEFKVMNLPNWKVYYYKNDNYWKIINDNGDIYYYGNTEIGILNNANENIIKWKNWIGDSNVEGGELQTVSWNLSKMTNQWNDWIRFYYNSVDRAVQTNNLGPKHTEASYLIKIESSSGDKIELSYLEKQDDSAVKEYYEPHTEINEPDAYQEYYETKYLDNIILKNSTNSIVLKYDLDYQVFGSGLIAKRYLTKITTYNDNNEHLNPQEFEYNTSGVFKGSLLKVKNSMGSEVTYEYENKFLFHNGPNRFEEGYLQENEIVKGFSDKSISDRFAIRGADPSRAKAFFIWKGTHWKADEFLGSNVMGVNNSAGFSFVYGKEYVGSSSYTSSNGIVTIIPDVHYIETNGTTFKKEVLSSITLPNGESVKDKIPFDDYYLIVTDRNKIIPVVNMGDRWEVYSTIILPGQTGVSESSLTNSLRGARGNHLWIDINATGYFSKSFMVSFEADKTFRVEEFDDQSVSSNSNSDKYFNLSEVSLSGGQFYTADYNRTHRYGRTYYNGASWISHPHDSNYDSPPIGYSLLHPSIGQKGFYYIQRKIASTSPLDVMYNVYLKDFNPNTNLGENAFIVQGLQFGGYFDQAFSIEDYHFVGNSIFEKNVNNSYSFYEQYDTYSFNQTGYTYYGYQSADKRKLLMHKDIKYPYAFNGPDHKWWYFFDKKDGSLGKKELLGGVRNRLFSNSFRRSGITNSIVLLEKNDSGLSGTDNYNQELYYIYENEIDQDIYDIVVKKVTVNNGVSQNVITEYEYVSPSILSDENIYYGEVVVENRGAGSSTIGKTYNYYDTGYNDIRLAGLLNKTVIKDISGNIVAETLNEYDLGDANYANNSIGKQVFIGNQMLPKKKTNKAYFTINGEIKTAINTVEYFYNNRGLLEKTKKIDSKGYAEEEQITYAYESTSAFDGVNLLSAVSKRINKVNGTSVKEVVTEWDDLGGRLYPKKKSSGLNTAYLRLDTEVTKISDKGIVEEVTDGKGIYSVNLAGYYGKYSVTTIKNARYTDVINALDVTYAQLNSLNTADLKVELLKLYDALPNAMISLTLYNENGEVSNTIDERKEEMYMYYDNFGRLSYATDGDGNVTMQKKYNYATN